MAGTLIYKQQLISGAPAVTDNVTPGNMRPVTSNAVAAAINETIKSQTIDIGDTGVVANNYQQLWVGPNNIEIISVKLAYWSQNTDVFFITPYQDKQVYLIARNGFVVKSLRIKIYYIDKN